MSNRTLIEGGIVYSMDPEIGDLAKGDVLIEDDKIVAIALVAMTGSIAASGINGPNAFILRR